MTERTEASFLTLAVLLLVCLPPGFVRAQTRVEGPVPSAQVLAKGKPSVVLLWVEELIQRGREFKAKARKTTNEKQRRTHLSEAEDVLTRAQSELSALLRRPNIHASDSADALNKLGIVHFYLNARYQAASTWADLVEKYPEWKDSTNAAVNAMIVSESVYGEFKSRPELEQAVTDLFDRCLTLLHENFPDHPQAKAAWYTRATFERDRGQLETAIAAYQKVPADQPNYPYALCETAYCHFTLATGGDKNLAARHAEKAVAACDLAKPVLAKAAQAGGEQGLRFLQALGDTVLWKAKIQIDLLNDAPAASDTLRGFDDQFAPFPALISEKRTLQFKIFLLLGQIVPVEREIDRLMVEAPDQVGPVLKSLLDSVTRQIDQARLSGQPQKARDLSTEGLRLARRLLEWAKSQPTFARSPDDLLSFELLVVDQLIAAGAHHQAIRLCEDLMAKPFGGTRLAGQPETGADRLDVVYGLAKSYFAAGQHEQAKPLLYRLQHPKESMALLKRRDIYWASWLMRCQIRDAEYERHKQTGDDEEAARVSSDIFRWIRKLEFGTEHAGTPKEMGGGKIRQQFRDLKLKHEPVISVAEPPWWSLLPWTAAAILPALASYMTGRRHARRKPTLALGAVLVPLGISVALCVGLVSPTVLRQEHTWSSSTPYTLVGQCLFAFSVSIFYLTAWIGRRSVPNTQVCQ